MFGCSSPDAAIASLTNRLTISGLRVNSESNSFTQAGFFRTACCAR